MLEIKDGVVMGRGVFLDAVERRCGAVIVFGIR